MRYVQRPILKLIPNTACEPGTGQNSHFYNRPGAESLPWLGLHFSSESRELNVLATNLRESILLKGVHILCSIVSYAVNFFSQDIL